MARKIPHFCARNSGALVDVNSLCSFMFGILCFGHEAPVRKSSDNSGEETIAMPCDGGAEGCRYCLGKEFQSTGAWWVKDLLVI